MPIAPRWFGYWQILWVRLLVYCLGASVAYVIFFYALTFTFGPARARVWIATILQYGVYALLIWLLVRALFRGFFRAR
jgi:hypothetical protein